MSQKNNPYAAFKMPEFRLYCATRFFITMALSLPPVLLGWRLYELTQDELVLGNVFLAEVIPALAISLFAGHFVDLADKRKLLLTCFGGYLLYAIALLGATSDWATDHIGQQSVIYAVYGIIFYGGVISAFSGPVGFAMMPQLVPRDLLVNASSWSSTSWQVGSIVGPAIAGWSYSWIGISWSLSLMLAFVLVGIVCIYRISAKPPAHTQKDGETIWQSLSIGLNFVFRTKEVLAALSLDMFAVLFGGAVALLPVFAKTILQAGPEGLGLLRSAPAIGTCLTLIAMAYFPIGKNPGVKLLVAVFGFGVSMIVFGLSKNIYLSFGCLFASGMLDGVSVNIRRNILQLKTPHEMRGRVASVNSMFIGSSNELGGYESGLTARLMGAVPAVVMGGCLTLGVVIATWFSAPALRAMELEE